MSKGSPRITIRLSPLFLAAVESAVKLFNEKNFEHPEDISKFIQKAIAEKLAHRARSRYRRAADLAKVGKISAKEFVETNIEMQEADDLITIAEQTE
jgi:hypothetical protein